MARLEHPASIDAIELTADPAFSRRIVRLAVTSTVALGLIWLAASRLERHWTVGASLGMGWLLMPTLLGLSLRWPRLRYGLIVPSSAVGLALVAICASGLPTPPAARAGWLLITGGVLFGGALGLWFWFRWIPVPRGLQDAFSAGRWALIAVHVGAILAGVALVGLQAL